MQLILFDTHTHFNFNAFKDDWKEVVERTLAKNVWFVNVGAEAKTSKRAVDIALKYSEGVYAAVGLHPIHTYDDENCRNAPVARRNRVLPCSYNDIEFITKAEEFDKKYYAKLIESSKKVIAVGEIGLDYFHIKKISSVLNKKLKAKQAEVFIEQIKLAVEYKKPIIIHCRPEKDYDAYRDILEILKSHKKIRRDSRVGVLINWGLPAPYRTGIGPEDDNNKNRISSTKIIPGIIHCFQANVKILEQFLDYGFMVGYNGVITFTDQYDELVKATPLERIVLETDAPWLAPIPHRGQRNESIYVEFVARRIADLKNISFEKVAKATTENAMKVFNLI